MIRSAGCLFVGAASATAFGDYVAGSNHVLPTGGAARFASMLSPRHFRRRMAEVRIGRGGGQAGDGGRADRPRGGLRGARRVDGGARRRQSDPDERRTATIERKTGETDVRLTLTLDGTGEGTRDTGVGFFDHMLDLLARHGRIDLDVKVSGDLQTGAHHTAEDTAIVLGPGARHGAGRPRGHRPLRVGDRADGRGARELCDRPLRPSVHAVRGGAPSRLHRGLRSRADRGVLQGAGQRGEAHAAPARGGGHQRTPHDRGGVQGVRARAAPGGRDRPHRDRGAEHEGNADT